MVKIEDLLPRSLTDDLLRDVKRLQDQIPDFSREIATTQSLYRDLIPDFTREVLSTGRLQSAAFESALDLRWLDRLRASIIEPSLLPSYSAGRLGASGYAGAAAELDALMGSVARSWRDPSFLAVDRTLDRAVLDYLPQLQSVARQARELAQAGRSAHVVEALRPTIERLSTLVAQLPALELSEDGELLLGGEPFDPVEIEESLDATFGEAVHEEPTLAHIQAQLEQVLTAVEQKQSTAIRFVLLNVLVPLLVSLAAGIILHASLREGTGVQRIPAAQLRAQVQRSAVPTHLLREYRLVVSSQLSMRLKRKRRSALVHTLHFGESVRLIERRRNWALVLKHDPITREAYVGWVMARFLQRFPTSQDSEQWSCD